MAYRQLGRTGFMISEMVMGGNTIAPDNYEHVLLAMDMGLNYLDTAPAYGNLKSEMGYAKVIASRKRDTFFLNTKISVWDLNRGKLYQQIFDSLPESDQKKLRGQAREEIERRRSLEPDYLGGYFPSQRLEIELSALSNVMAKTYGHKIDRDKNYKQIVLDSLDASLRRLGTDHVDLLMCPHGASTQSELLDHPEIFEAFEILKKQGKVRHLGVSAHNDPAGILEAAVQAKVYSAAMVAFSIVNRAYTEKAVEHARKNGLGVIAMKVARPVFNGRNNGTPDDPKRVQLVEDAVAGPLKVPQKAYLWALRNPNLSAVISELVNANLVKENLPLAGRKPKKA
ncbi:MAG: aldo/keto reductase [Acidobacteriia bacterium]|nr:aldo/keto reductase [Terriglobia bacterium]